MQKGSRTKVVSDSDSDLDYSDYSKKIQARNRKKTNAKKPKNSTELIQCTFIVRESYD